MSDIFLSYASEDRERVRPLADALMAAGWTVYWDRKIPVGKTWEQMLEEELATASSLVVVWSNHAVKSQWFREEANEARRRSCRYFRFYWMGCCRRWGFAPSRELISWTGTARRLHPSFKVSYRT